MTRHRRSPGYVGHRSYDTDVTADSDRTLGDPIPILGDTSATATAPDRIDLDPHSAIPIAIAFAILAVSVWLVRSIPRTLALTAIASLIAFALDPVGRSAAPPDRWHRRYAAAVVLVSAGVIVITTIALVLVPTINQVRDFNKEIPKTVDQTRHAADHRPAAPARRTRRRRSGSGSTTSRSASIVNTTPIANAAGAIADGIAATLFALLLAITLVLDGERLVNMGRRLVPERRRPDADRLGRLVYDVVGRYIAGTLFMAALAGVVTLVASLSLGVPLAPLLAVWVAICNPIPQIGGFLGAVPFVALGLTASAVVGRHLPRRVPHLPADREPRAAAADHRPRGAAHAAGDDGRGAHRRRRGRRRRRPARDPDARARPRRSTSRCARPSWRSRRRAGSPPAEHLPS